MDFGLFGIGLPQILLIALVALIVFGPERLPGIARQAGRYVNDLRKLTQEARGEIQSLTKDLSGSSEDLLKDFKDVRSSLVAAGQDLTAGFKDVQKEIDLRDEAGNLLGQQREQYSYQVQELPPGSSDENGTVRIEETVRRETIIQEVVEGEPATSTELITSTSNFDTGQPEVDALDPNVAVVEDATLLEPAFTSDLATAEAMPPVYNGNGSSPLGSPDGLAGLEHLNGATASALAVNDESELRVQLSVLEERLRDQRHELNERMAALEEQFLTRLDRLEQNLLERAHNGQGG